MWARALVEDQSLVVSWVRVLRRGSVVGRVVGQGFASWVSRGSGFCVVGQSWVRVLCGGSVVGRLKL